MQTNLICPPLILNEQPKPIIDAFTPIQKNLTKVKAYYKEE